VHVHADLEAPCEPSTLFSWVDDLSRYPDWLEIVPRAEADGDGEWFVDLRGRLGPLARSKRLRMARVDLVEGRAVRFERRENDGRQHAEWVLEAEVSADPGGSRLSMDLRYDGGFGGRLLERMLRDEIERSRPRLLALVSR
jgi:hypothetical protein